MRDEVYFWSVVLCAMAATQIVRFAPFFLMKYVEKNHFVQLVTKSLAPALLALLIMYCFKDNLVGGINLPYSLMLPLIILVYLQVRTKNALLSIGLATAAHAFLLKI